MKESREYSMTWRTARQPAVVIEKQGSKASSSQTPITLAMMGYQVRPSVLGGRRLTTLNDSGAKISTKVYGGGGEIAEQRAAGSAVVWRHADAVTGSFNTTTQAGYLYQENEAEFNAEFEPLGAVLPQEDPAFDPDTDPMPVRYQKRGGGNPFEPEVVCIVNHIWEEYCNEGRAHLMAHYSGTIGGAFISFERYVDDTTVSLPCGEDDGPGCVPIGPDVSNPRITYNVAITQLPRFFDHRDTFESGKERALKTLKNNKNCREAVGKILKTIGEPNLVSDFAISGRNGERTEYSPIDGFVYDAKTETSGLRGLYDSVGFAETERSGNNGTSTTYAQALSTYNGESTLRTSLPSNK